MSLTIDSDGRWCMAAAEESTYLLRVEYSKSGRAKCRGCDQKIAAKEVRIGKPVKWRGIITSWCHPACFWISSADTYFKDVRQVRRKRVHGYAQLQKEDKALIRAAIARFAPPPHLREKEGQGIEDGEVTNRKKQLDRIRQPVSFQVDLLPFQEEGLGWMIDQEASAVKGGILADEMGLGKTIQTVALVLEQKERRGSLGPTLVVCPASALLQWSEEIDKCAGDALSAFVFHGSVKSLVTPAELMAQDIVLTTFPVVEHAHRLCSNLQKERCRFCDKKFLPEKLLLHNKYFCGPQSKRTQRLSKTDRSGANKKAMATLRIGESSLPTPSQIYREIMHEANKRPVSMYAAKEDAEMLSREGVREVCDSSGAELAPGEIPGPLWLSVGSDCVFVAMQLTKKERRRIGVDSSGVVVASNVQDGADDVASKRGTFKTFTVHDLNGLCVLSQTPFCLLTGNAVVVPMSLCIDHIGAHLFCPRERLKSHLLQKGLWLIPTDVDCDKLLGRVCVIDGADKPDLGLVVSQKNAQYVIHGRRPGEEHFVSGTVVRKASTKKKLLQFFDVSTDLKPLENEKVKRTESKVTENVLKRSPVSFKPVSWGSDGFMFDEFLASRRPRKTSRKRKISSMEGDLKKTKDKEVFEGDEESSLNQELDIAESIDIEEEETISDLPFRYANSGEIVDENGIDLGFSILHSVAWHRIVLDEAHKIKDRTNSTAKAVFSLRGEGETEAGSTFRWCLTGTPIQNRVGELYALVRFLRMQPFAFYFCSTKNCDCKQLNWGFSGTKLCACCGHSSFKHFSYFNKTITNPIQRSGYTGAGKTAVRVLRNELLEVVMLRRTKKERASDIKLPDLKVSVCWLEMSDAEKEFYKCLYSNISAKFSNYVKAGTLLHNYAHIFQLLSRLRRSADHPYLVIHGANETPLTKLDSDKEKKESNATSKEDDTLSPSDVCAVCNEDILNLADMALAGCKHTFHKSCIKKLTLANLEEKVISECPTCYQPLQVNFDFKDGTGYGQMEECTQDDTTCVICFENPRNALILPCGHLFTCMACTKSLEQKSCPICREPIQKIHKTVEKSNSKDVPGKHLFGRKSILQKIALDQFESSTKLDAVVREIKSMDALPVEEGEQPHKAIVFSQYSDMIDLMEWSLRREGFETGKLVGSLPVKQRQAVLRAFREKPSVKILLMSLKAGGEGLNLQNASHVFILETWWNPQVHNQAFQRAHRIGQKRVVQAKLFVLRSTIEERMYELQQKKELVFQGAVEGSESAMTKLTEEDLKFLFSA